MELAFRHLKSPVPWSRSYLRAHETGSRPAVDQQVQRTPGAPIRDVDGQGLLAAGQRAEVRHRPVQVDQAKQALDKPGCLPERHAEQHLQGEAGLDRGIAVGVLSATPTGRRCLPDHLGIEPDRQRASALERLIVGRPVPRLVGQACGSAHVDQLPCWIHDVNPSGDLCNRASNRAKKRISIRSTLWSGG